MPPVEIKIPKFNLLNTGQLSPMVVYVPCNFIAVYVPFNFRAVYVPFNCLLHFALVFCVAS